MIQAPIRSLQTITIPVVENSCGVQQGILTFGTNLEKIRVLCLTMCNKCISNNEYALHNNISII
jgi:hypothetical protein